jgi:hypothetical protein
LGEFCSQKGPPPATPSLRNHHSGTSGDSKVTRVEDPLKENPMTLPCYTFPPPLPPTVLCVVCGEEIHTGDKQIQTTFTPGVRHVRLRCIFLLKERLKVSRAIGFSLYTKYDMIRAHFEKAQPLIDTLCQLRLPATPPPPIFHGYSWPSEVQTPPALSPTPPYEAPSCCSGRGCSSCCG